MSAPIRKGGKPAAFGAKLRIYAAHNPTILQMVANLSMPMYYRFHFPTWMETHKGLKNCFCPRSSCGSSRAGEGRGMIAQSFSSGSRPIAQKGPATFIHDFFLHFRSLRKKCRNRSMWTKLYDIRHRGKKKNCNDQSNEENEWINLSTQRNIYFG